MRWIEEQINFLIEWYPKKGKQWCMDQLNLSEGKVRSKASQLKLKAMGVSEAWHNNNKAHSARMSGRKRPDHSEFMKQWRKENKVEMTPEIRQKISIANKNNIAKNGHPRGALGMKHTEEAKARMSQASKEMWENMSEEKKDEYSKRAAINGLKQTMNRANASWKAGWREIGGYKKYYRSRWEANYARYLEWLRQNGSIAGWLHECETFWFEGIKRGCMSYLPDFKVKEINGTETYHEVKGWMDARSKTKIKRMAKYHPDVKLIVIDAKKYKNLEKQLKGLIEGWE